MKKAIIVLLAAVLLTACTGYNDSKAYSEGKFEYEISGSGKEAMAHVYYWDGTEEGLVVEIPDETAEGVPVRKFGGFIGIGVPTPFTIDYGIDYELLVDLDEQNTDEIIDKDITFTIRLGKNVEKAGGLNSLFYEIERRGVRQQDGSVAAYHVSVFFDVDPENKKLYSKDGKLYSRTAEGDTEIYPTGYVE